MIDGARDGDPLPLTTGQRQPGFADPGVVAEWQLRDELVRTRYFGCPQHALHIRLLLSKRDVARDGVGKYVAVLEGKSDVSAEVAVVQRLEIEAIVKNRSVRR